MNLIHREKIGYKDLFVLLVSYCFNILLIAITFSMDSILNLDKWLLYFSIISVIQLLMTIVLLKVLKEHIISFSVIFIVLSYLFHFGQIILMGFKVEIEFIRNILAYVAVEDFKDASLFSFYVQIMLSLGVITLMTIKKNPELLLKRKKDFEITKQLNILNKIGIIFIAVGFFPKIYIDLTEISLFYTEGYLATYDTGVDGYLYLVSKFMNIGIYLVIIANHKKEKLAMCILFMAGGYQFFSMLSGGRGESILNIIVLLFLYFKFFGNINFKKMSIYFLVGYLILLVLNVIREIRLLNNISSNDIILIVKDTSLLQPIFETLNEFGSTFFTVCLTVMYGKSFIDISWGENYIVTALMLLPVLGSSEGIMTSAVYLYNLPINTNLYLGGSYIGELYYSFGNMGIVFAFLIGIIIGTISLKIKKFFVEEEYLKLSILIVFVPKILWWIRDYFAFAVKEFVWSSLVIFILYQILRKK